MKNQIKESWTDRMRERTQKLNEQGDRKLKKLSEIQAARRKDGVIHVLKRVVIGITVLLGLLLGIAYLTEPSAEEYAAKYAAIEAYKKDAPQREAFKKEQEADFARRMQEAETAPRKRPYRCSTIANARESAGLGFFDKWEAVLKSEKNGECVWE